LFSDPEYDCQRCGACCTDFFGSKGYVRLGKRDSERMERLGLPVLWDGGEAWLGTYSPTGETGGAFCSAFVGEVGNSCRCSIYSDRPDACHRFELGGKWCRAARINAGLPC
jgi:Fe-S-cluster containining protein